MSKPLMGTAKIRAERIELSYHTLRNISSPEDVENDRKVYGGNILCDQVLDLSTDENVREYLVEAEGKKRRAKTQVHRAIERTLFDRPEDFAILNAGLVIVAKDAEVDDSKKILRLLKPSIVNGAQTQGVLRDFYKKYADDRTTPPPIHIKFELIVTADEELVGEISIARNFQNDVMTVSIVGRRGMFEELESKFQLYVNTPDGLKLRKKETDLTEDFVRTERMVQVLTALTPESLWMRSLENGIPSKSYTYSASSKCLKEYQSTYTLAKSDPKNDDSPHVREQRQKAKALYAFYLDVVGQVWEIYNKWKAHPDFKGTYLRKIDRDETGNVTNVPDGIVFPILASLSVFARNSEHGWTIDVPSEVDSHLIQAAKQVYMNVAHSNPSTMGRSQACYALINMIATSFANLSRK
jgi:AIPR protein